MIIGRYEVITTLGASSTGVVFHARDPESGRDVAIKVMPREYLEDVSYRRRLENAKVMGNLNHPSVVPVLERGKDQDQPYIVMPFMAGGSLTDWLEKEVLTLSEATSVIVRLAPGVDAAHERGIIHCMLKPSNILFDEYKKAYIVDFGIAPLSDVNLGNTHLPVFGEPAYMSPEQIMGELLDGRSDIYTLGILLYEMLTGAPPYQADSPIGTALMQLNDPVPDLLAARPDLPRACQTVIARSLAKDRELRFKMAAEMAVMLSEIDMGHHSQKRPAVRPVAVTSSAPEESSEAPPGTRQLPDFSALQAQAQTFLRETALPFFSTLAQNTASFLRETALPFFSTLAQNTASFLRETVLPFFKRPPAELIRDRRVQIGGGVILVLIVIGVLALTGVFGRSEQVDPIPTPTATAVAAAANTSPTRAEPTDRPTHPPDSIPSPTAAETDTPEPTGLTPATAGQLAPVGTLQGHIIDVWGVDWSPDGTQLVTGGGDLFGLIWDVAAGSTQLTLDGHNDYVTDVVWSPDGSRIVTASNDSALRIWDAADGSLLQTLNGHLASIIDVDWSPDGSWIVSGALDGQIIVWDADSGEKLAAPPDRLSSVRSVAFSTDSSQVASGSDDWKILLADTETLTPRQTLSGHIAAVNALAYSPDGQWLASSGFDRKVMLWALDGSEAPFLVMEGHQGDVPDVAFSPDGSVLVSAGMDGQLLVWDVKTGDLLNTLTAGDEAGGLLSVAISPDGTTIAAGAENGSVLLWGITPS